MPEPSSQPVNKCPRCGCPLENPGSARCPRCFSPLFSPAGCRGNCRSCGIAARQPRCCGKDK